MNRISSDADTSQDVVESRQNCSFLDLGISKKGSACSSFSLGNYQRECSVLLL